MLSSSWLRTASAAFVLCASPVGAANLVINEVDYDQPGTDLAEFIEIRNVSAGSIDLSLYEVVLINGSNTTTYNPTALSGTLEAGAYFVVCSNAANTPNCDLDVAINQDFIQNGAPDAVAVRLIVGSVIEDALSYEGSVTGFTEGTGTPTSAPDDNATANIGLARSPSSADSDDNSADFSIRCITPGYENSTASADCPAPSVVSDDPLLSIDDVSLAEGNSGTTTFEFVVTLDKDADAEFTVNWRLEAVTAAANDDFVDATGTLTFTGGTAGTQTISVAVNGDTDIEDHETFSVILENLQGATVDIADAIGTGTILNDDVQVVEIHAIQGSGLRSPMAPASGGALGDQVRTDDNIVTAVDSSGSDMGFWIQTPDARVDGSAETSQGIFVFTGTAPTVQVGDQVDVTGEVREFFEQTQIGGTLLINTDSSGNALPTPVVLDETVPSADPDALSCMTAGSNFECFESMRVSVAAGAVVTGNQRFGSDPYAEAFVTASGFRGRREEGLLPSVTPPDAGLPVWDGNPEVFELDADGAGVYPSDTALFGGDLFSATGVLGFQFGNFALRATDLVIVPAELPRAVPAASEDIELRVGSFNVLNLCNSDCSVGKFGRIAAYIGDVLRLPDVVGLQEVGTADAAAALATRLNTDYGTDYTAVAGFSQADGIRNAFLYKVSRLANVQVRDLDELVETQECSGTPPCVLHDRPPLLLEAEFVAAGNVPFAVMNNHTRSLIGITDPTDGPRVRAKRFEQAQSIATLVQRFQQGLELEVETPAATDTAGVPLILVGDYNAFEVTDGYVDVVGVIAGTYDNAENEYDLPVDGGGATDNITEPALRSLVLSVPEEDRYSYAFVENLGALIGETPRTVGSIQVLDHALVSASAEIWCPTMDYGRGNADAPEQLRNVGTGAIASSDHDGLVVRLFTNRNGQCSVSGVEAIFSDGFED